MKLPPKVVLTNDDGIDAPGIRVLQRVIGQHAVLVAPNNARSGCSHYVTMNHPIHVVQRSESEIQVDGTPGDCTRLALKEFVPEVDLIISGINEGGNLGHDIYLSGTVAAAREAAFHGLPAIAISQYFRPEVPLDWERSAEMAAEAIAQVLEVPLAPRSFWNVNLPHLEAGARKPEVIFCDYCRQPLPTQYRNGHDGFLYVKGLYHSRGCDPESDVAVCFGGDISVTLLQI